MNHEVTVILTSCNRPDLLKKTLDSFFQTNTYPIKSFHIHNDGDRRGIMATHKFYPHLNWHFPDNRIGYSKSLDKLLQVVDTEYFMTVECDWLFYNPGFIERSLKIMEENKDISQVWIRDEKDFGHPLGAEMEVSGIRVKPVIPGFHKVWNGFSLNPGLRRMSDWKLYFPNGLAEYGDEAVLAERTKLFNYKAVCLVESSIRHLGWHRRSINFRA
jgi:GT2 family glycosyltransferase